ncbi:hypothetical protein GBAR_LOCUS24160 [Geodia barretti]|uniref:Uncharacterized protein n=1 Tax=Geodia barretti TaxID=519541 RepID=A0AA35T954_GEOBA|nr:hypothetical protein GBAR_LOCUS24160 [Geodia barretti]
MDYAHLSCISFTVWSVQEPVSPRLAKGSSPVGHWSALVLSFSFSLSIFLFAYALRLSWCVE